MKIIEITADAGHTDTIHGLAGQFEVSDIWCGPVNEHGRISVKLLLDDNNRQAILDSLQSMSQASETAKIVVSPVEAVLPKALEKAEDKKERPKKATAAVTREEIYSTVEINSRLHRGYITLVILSSIEPFLPDH